MFLGYWLSAAGYGPDDLPWLSAYRLGAGAANPSSLACGCAGGLGLPAVLTLGTAGALIPPRMLASGCAGGLGVSTLTPFGATGG